ncbi:hypothetical protein BT63DRAFT_451611 [Microthyrium microscopicum]|uniref:LITAF domain-containing protein n=1 Tax=Microthyrium microscopicum TaxID=703497 RepID=A0A6A6UP64_9PEZI|nr:hypothetical protein BT63DRAFT_451611 [Microthyrium microscopicum]
MEKAQPPAYVTEVGPGTPQPMAQQPQYPPQMQHPQMQPQGYPQGQQPMYAQQPMQGHPTGAPMMHPQQQYQQPMMQQQQQPQMAYQQPHMMQQQPVMMQPQTSVFQSAVPIQTLSESSAPIDCPSCKQRGMTNTSRVSGDCTHLWALGFCLVLLMPCIPYLIDGFKDVVHKCGKCGVTVATWKKSGGTTVHVFA